jgi:prephenate dehydrogenase
MAATPWEGRLLVVGAGLIGTSVGLAARAAGAEVFVADIDRGRLELAASLGAGTPIETTDSRVLDMDLTLVAAPPAATGTLCASLLKRAVKGIVSHVASVQHQPQLEIELSALSTDRFLGSHPVAGRELSGPAHAGADLFRDRPWVLCPTASTTPAATALLRDLVLACGAEPVEVDALTHDRLFAHLSHVPQLVASALAASLIPLSAGGAALAGAGVRDTTRLADSDPQMWAEIATANAGPVTEGLRAVATSLLRVADALAAPDTGTAAVRDLVRDGRTGRAMLPGKHGRKATELAEVEVVVPDQPGALADLLAAVAAERINLEDLRVEHAPGQPVGVAGLVVPPEVEQALVTALRAAGWTVSAGSTTAL